MEGKSRLEQLEKLKQKIEKENDFEKIVQLFSEAAVMVKENISSATTARGKLLEIIRDLDGYIEKELKLGAEEC